MKKLGIAALLAASVLGGSAHSVSAAEVPGPCERQQALFEKYNIEFGMDAPLGGDAYNAACDATG